MSFDDFILGKQLGKGSFSWVNIVTRKQDKKKYAMKRVNIINLSEKEKLSSLNEIRILSSLNHPNIIGYKEAFFDSKTRTLNIVMEYADDGDLQQKIKNNLKNHLHFTENTIWEWFIQILEGIKYLHDNKIMHRDLKSANIFITKNGIVKIGDLNVSIIAKLGMAKTRTGTPYYCSPEIWKDLPYDYKSDIWSMGCILYELCMLKPPFRGTSLKELCFNIIKGSYLPIIKYYSDDLIYIISRILVVDPNKRATLDELLSSDILKKRISMMRKNIITNEINIGQKRKQVNFMETIKLPRNFKEINNKLPKNKYNPEDEMMENDEFETMKSNFFHEMKNKMDKNEEKIIFNKNQENENVNNNIRQNYNLNNRRIINNIKYKHIIESNKGYKKINENNKNIEIYEEQKNYENNYVYPKNKYYNNNYFYNINYKNNHNNNIKRNFNIIALNKYNENNKIIDYNYISNDQSLKKIYNSKERGNIFNYFENKDNNIDINEFQEEIINNKSNKRKQIRNIDNNISNESNKSMPMNKDKENKDNLNYKKNEKNNKKVNELECEKTKNLQKRVSSNQNILINLLNKGNINNNNYLNIKENEFFKIKISNNNNENIINYRIIPYKNNKLQNIKLNDLDQINNNHYHKRVITPDNLRKNKIFENDSNNNKYTNKNNKYYNIYSYENINKIIKNKKKLNNIRGQLINNPLIRASNDNIMKKNNLKVENKNNREYIRIKNNHVLHCIYYSKKNNYLNDLDCNKNNNIIINDN